MDFQCYSQSVSGTTFLDVVFANDEVQMIVCVVLRSSCRSLGTRSPKAIIARAAREMCIVCEKRNLRIIIYVLCIFICQGQCPRMNFLSRFWVEVFVEFATKF